MDGVKRTREWLHAEGVKILLDACHGGQAGIEALEALLREAKQKKLELAQPMADDNAAAADDDLMDVNNDDGDDARANDADALADDDIDSPPYDAVVVAVAVAAPAPADHDANLMKACSG